MSLWSTLPPDEQLVIEPADEADLALAGEQDERAELAAYRRARRRARTRRLGIGATPSSVDRSRNRPADPTRMTVR